MASKKSSKSGFGSTALLAAAILAVLLWFHYDGNLEATDLPGLSLGAPAAAAEPGGYVHPVAGGTVTSGYGTRWGTTHGGIDIAAPLGTPIRAITNGTVIEAGPATGFGLWLRLQHPDGAVSVYGHMHTLHAATGDQVAAGERIATVGTRGQSTGPHLHLEIWPGGDRSARVDPAPWLAARSIQL